MSTAPGSGDNGAIARHHLELRTAVVIARLLEVLDDALGRGIFKRDDVERRFPFIAATEDQLTELAGGHRHDGDPDHFRRLAADVAARADRAPPLARLAGFAAPLDGSLAVDVMAAAALVERDARFGAVIASLQAPTAAHRPCTGLMAMLFRREIDEVAAVVAALAAGGFVTVDDEAMPRAEQSARIPTDVLTTIEGAALPALDIMPADTAPSFAELVVPDVLRDRIVRAAILVQRGEVDAFVVRGATGTGRRTVVRAVAAADGRGALVSAPRVAAGAIAVLTGSMLAWTVDAGIGQLVSVPRPPGVGAIAIVAGVRGAVRVEGGERTVVIDLPTPDAAARRRFWTAAPIRAPAEVIDAVSSRYALSGGAIGEIATLAAALASIDNRPLVAINDVRLAAQDRGRQRLESFATLLAPLPAELAPVLGGATAEGFETLVLRCRHREALGPAVGGAAGAEITPGVRALLSGPSGTGKTLSARALGTRLDLDVYRANLAALVDKYIGETERRLDELFSRAEELDVILLIDEGDALMTRRTDVRSSNDRYANLETDYLLQRLESYAGIVLITTNAPQLIDTAFRRRIDVAIQFGPPSQSDRLQIWLQHLPAQHAVTPDALATVAATCRLTGGQIRNAAVHAALVALDTGALVDDTALSAAVAREFAISGQTSPVAATERMVSPYEWARAGA